MRKTTRNLIQRFLCGETSAQEFVGFCKNSYDAAVRNREKSTNLEAILVLPFLHEFAHCALTEQELKIEATSFLEIIDGHKDYDYSVFIRLPLSSHTSDVPYSLSHNPKAVDFNLLKSVFCERINDPSTLKAILHNAIFDIFSKTNLKDIEESDFDYVYSKKISISDLKDRIARLLSYYLGLSSFLLQLTVSAGKLIYVII